MALESEKIKEDVVNHLLWDSRLRSEKIDVSVTGNTVVLSGSVPSFRERMVAEADTWAVPGIASVENRVQIGDFSRVSDKQLMENAVTVLHLNEVTEDQKIAVNVEDGKFVLSGSVDEYWKKTYTVDLLAHVKGVIDIIDNMAVVPGNQIADESVAEDILEALKRQGKIDVSTITLEVSGGKAVIRGRVPDWQSFSDSYSILKNTKGVAEIRNELTIVPEGVE
ncbi:BON domain-containing protein [Chitinispirillales bacterium ANBcel5]|uniref:BON domain-containing protein n=1 Tax=Cellulosispirillum alkaliphilum TaxID=3039283 RepID=UPI002A5330FB|nr:BON domain-containing protein [Chitinispirillales bacterium ANBcel5]